MTKLLLGIQTIIVQKNTRFEFDQKLCKIILYSLPGRILIFNKKLLKIRTDLDLTQRDNLTNPWMYFFVFLCIFILLSRKSDQSAKRARIGVASYLSTTPKWVMDH